MIHTVKGFCAVNEAEVGGFLELSCFFYDSANVGIWSLVSLPFLKPVYTSGSSQFTDCWPSLKDFEHNLTSMWNERSCLVVWTFFGIALLWDWNENWLFPVLQPLLIFQIGWHIECSSLTVSSFMSWNNSWNSVTFTSFVCSNAP